MKHKYIDITAEDIARAELDYKAYNLACPYCPTSQALRRLGYENPVTTGELVTGDQKAGGRQFIVSKSLQREIMRWPYQGYNFRPGRYRITFLED